MTLFLWSFWSVKISFICIHLNWNWTTSDSQHCFYFNLILVNVIFCRKNGNLIPRDFIQYTGRYIYVCIHLYLTPENIHLCKQEFVNHFWKCFQFLRITFVLNLYLLRYKQETSTMLEWERKIMFSQGC